MCKIDLECSGTASNSSSKPETDSWLNSMSASTDLMIPLNGGLSLDFILEGILEDESSSSDNEKSASPSSSSSSFDSVLMVGNKDPFTTHVVKSELPDSCTMDIMVSKMSCDLENCDAESHGRGWS